MKLCYGYKSHWKALPCTSDCDIYNMVCAFQVPMVLWDSIFDPWYGDRGLLEFLKHQSSGRKP